MSSLKKGASLQNGKYIISSALGQGGFGITYEAEQTSLGRKVAVKEFFMKEHCNRDEATSQVSVPSTGSRELVERFRQKFIREAKMIAALDHEHIVKIYDVFEENGTAYYVMEYLGGGSLGDGVKAGKAMSEGDALESIRQIAPALSYLHSKGIIHFDVKPSNILKTEDGKLKLIDFGISKHYDEAGQQTSSTPVGISKGYAPLEQYQQGSDIKSFTPATDVYSLGATLYALLSGSNPPEASVVNEDGLPIITGISPNVMHAIEKAMQPRRKDRPQSVDEFLRLLDGPIADDEETVVPGSGAGDAKTGKGKSSAIKPTEPKKTSEPKPERKKSKGFPKWLYGLFAGIAVAVLAVVLFNRSDNPDVTDVPLTDSTAVVAEAVPETPAKSQLSEPASKPESPAKPEAPTVIELKSISLNKTTLELEEGSSVALTVKYSPNNATDKTTTWKSSNTSVAKVSTDGNVTAVKAGSATIIATCSGKDAYCNVTVKAKEVQPEVPAVIELQSIALSETTLELEEGSSATLTVKYNPSNATDKTTTWKSSNTSVAKVSTNGKVTALKAGSAAIVARCGDKDAYCNVTVKAEEVQPSKPEQIVTQTAQSALATTGTHNGHEWVDLGLSVKWATCNLGASSPKGYGSYFAWGETSPKSEYTWANLKYCNDSTGDSFSKYNQTKNGTKDNKTKLDLSDDAARASWGGSWRMPTYDEFEELENNCTWTWTKMNGKNGYKVVSKSNGNSIFLPAAGCREDTSLYDAGGYGCYWSSSLYEGYSGSARFLCFNSGEHGTRFYYRKNGWSVRPVFR